MNPTDQEKVAYLNNDVCYEAEELMFCHNFLWSLFAHRTELEQRSLFPALQNTGLEHFGLHARVLLEFLFYDSHEGYARATDYVDGWTSMRKMTKSILVLQKRVNSEISHLGWERLKVKPEEKGWQPLPIAQDLLDIYELFLSKVDDHCKQERAKLLQVALGQYKNKMWDVFGILMRPSH